MTATIMVTEQRCRDMLKHKSAKEKEQAMFERAILALAFVSAMAAAGPTLACEMHHSHANLTTAAAEPAPLPPAPVPEVDTQALQSAPAIPEEPAASMSKRHQSGYTGCPQMRTKDQTVYLTN